MRDVRDILRNNFGNRFLDPQQFWDYANNLQIVDGPFARKDLLQFLERERLLIPICRVRYPAEVVRVWYANEHPYWADSSLPTEADDERMQAATDLYRGIRYWGAPPTPDRGVQFHPLDLIDRDHSEFVETDIAGRAFQAWGEFEIHAGTSDGHPMTSSSVDTYYRYWQVLRLPEILSMAVPTLVNFGDGDAFRMVCEHRLAEIPPEKIHHLSCSLLGWQAQREFPQNEPCFEAVAFFRAYRERALLEAAKDQPGAAFKVSGKALEDFRTMETAIARHAAWRWNQSDARILEFIKWECQRWDRWAKAGCLRLCEDYERNVSDTIWFYRLITGAEYQDVVQAVGQVTGHFRKTLDVMFPDWFQEQRELADRSLKNWIAPTMSVFTPIAHGFSAVELEEFLAWIFARVLSGASILLPPGGGEED